MGWVMMTTQKFKFAAFTSFCPSVVVFLRSSDSPSCVGRDVAGLGWVGAVRCVALRWRCVCVLVRSILLFAFRCWFGEDAAMQLRAQLS